MPLVMLLLPGSFGRTSAGRGRDQSRLRYPSLTIDLSSCAPRRRPWPSRRNCWPIANAPGVT